MQIDAVTAVTSNLPPSTSLRPQQAASAQTPAPAGAAAESLASQPATSAPASLFSEIYATRVAGKDYLGSVAYASGVYTISVASLPGAEGSGASLFAAENALNARIDILV